MSRIILILLIISAFHPVNAGEFRASSFVSIVAGAVIDGERQDPLNDNPDVKCPCFVTDWANNGFYEGSSWTTKQDSKAGVQLMYVLNDAVSVTGQVITRGVEPKPDLTWAYVSWKFLDDFQLDIGRKRVPLYYYSDFQDVGVSYPWITPPGELYGWETTNYNGASFRHQSSWNGVGISTGIFTGRGSVEDNPYLETYASYSVDTLWHHMVGGDVEMSQDWWTLRLVYLEADVEFDYQPGIDRQDMKSYGMAFNGDFGDWFFLSEAGVNNRDYIDAGYTIKAPAYSLGVGYRWGGAWTAFVNYAQYREISDDEAYAYFRYNSHSIVLRYDLTSSSDIKVQFDLHDDDSTDFTGSSQLLRISYDAVF